ncbi:MAG: type IVB secretion system protein IcmH/DotU [Pseudomonadota bacterium]
MADEDPFAEPDDTDKTVIRPNPGGRRTPAVAEPAAPAPSADAGVGVPERVSRPAGSKTTDAETMASAMTGMNQLNATASTLFSLVSRIRNRAQHMDPGKLRESVVAEIREFESRCLNNGIPPQTVKAARYAICATLDDVVLNTPWGGHSEWAQKTLVGTFHREVVGGDRFYDLLARLEKDPGNNLELLEFLYVCLSLGFEGRLRVEQGGPEKHMRIRQGLARLIRANSGEVENDLSPNWKGLDVPFKPRSFWKLVWISLGATGALLLAIYLTLSILLSGSTDRLIGQLALLDNVPPPELVRRAPRPLPPDPPPQVEEQLQRVSGFLEPEVKEGIVEVFKKGNTITVRVVATAMFGSGSDRLQPAYTEALRRIGTALNDEQGPIIVVGHTDSIPVTSGRFKDNMHLSLSRAEAVMQMLAPQIEEKSRLSAEGRAEKEPIASNESRDGRAKNRRIEVLLIQESQS